MYARDPSFMQRISERASPYLHYIVESVEHRHAPLEVALLPVVESGFEPFAYSQGRASGLWQFIPATGRRFGLEQNWWYDGRRDVYASTQAALDYLLMLREQFDGDWLLALAAYNSGSGTVRRAIRQNRERGKPTDFWSLDLPRETRMYVPRLLAICAIIEDPDRFGVDLEPIPNQPYLTRVALDWQLDLSVAAEAAGISVDEMRRYNPGFNRWATAPDGPHYLMLPTERVRSFAREISKLPADQRVRWDRYRVRSGDSLSTIAAHHGITVSLLKQVNHLKSNSLRAGADLLIPSSASATAVALAAKNHGGRSNDGRHKQIHTVASGESLWTIARQHKVSTRDLAEWNQLSTKDTLRIGQKLVVWTGEEVASVALPDFSAGPDSNLARQTIWYTVHDGDSLWSIAKHFNVHVREVKRWNGLARTALHAGQRLKLHVDVTQLAENR